MKRHAILAASSAHRWIKCPGSIRMTRDIADTRSSAADLGTAAHVLGEGALRGQYKINPKIGLAGVTVRLEDKQLFLADPEMSAAVMFHVNHVTQLLKDKPARLFLEQRVSLEHVRPNMFGTLDVAIHYPKRRHLVVIDYKHGFTPVHLVTMPDIKSGVAEVNPQLMFYAAGMLHQLKDERVERVTLEIIQPRCQEVEPCQTITLPAESVTSWAEDTLWEAACATDMADAPLNAGEHCRFCPALAVCPAVHKLAENTALTDFSALATRPIEVPMEPAALSKVLRAAPLIDAWLRACEAAAMELLMRGQPVDGFKLVRKRANREWPTEDALELYGRLVKAGGAQTKKELRGESKSLFKQELISPAQLEKVVGKAVVDKVAIKPESGLTLAAASDRREAVDPSSDFEDML